jgi:hypothetical protein
MRLRGAQTALLGGQDDGLREASATLNDHSTRKVRRATALPRVGIADASPATATE